MMDDNKTTNNILSLLTIFTVTLTEILLAVPKTTWLLYNVLKTLVCDVRLPEVDKNALLLFTIDLSYNLINVRIVVYYLSSLDDR